HGLGRDVFELEGGDVHGRGEALERLTLGKLGDRGGTADLGCGAVGLGGEDVAAKAKPCGGECRHPAELSAAQDADRGTRSQFGRRSHRRSGRSATPWVCACRQLSRACSATASDKPRIAAANSAALTAPARPMAKVATGIPAGICTIDSKLSIPLRARLSIGTPSTGSGVKAATMPGR